MINKQYFYEKFNYKSNLNINTYHKNSKIYEIINILRAEVVGAEVVGAELRGAEVTFFRGRSDFFFGGLGAEVVGAEVVGAEVTKHQ